MFETWDVWWAREENFTKRKSLMFIFLTFMVDLVSAGWVTMVRYLLALVGKWTNAFYTKQTQRLTNRAHSMMNDSSAWRKSVWQGVNLLVKCENTRSRRVSRFFVLFKISLTHLKEGRLSSGHCSKQDFRITPFLIFCFHANASPLCFCFSNLLWFPRKVFRDDNFFMDSLITASDARLPVYSNAKQKNLETLCIMTCIYNQLL